MAIRLITSARCFAGAMLFLPLQFKLTDRNRITLLYACFAQGFIHTERLHDLLEATHRAIVLPIGHRSGAFDGRAGDAPFVCAFAPDGELAWIFLRTVDWHRRLDFFERG